MESKAADRSAFSFLVISRRRDEGIFRSWWSKSSERSPALAVPALAGCDCTPSGSVTTNHLSPVVFEGPGHVFVPTA
jgi:hypothetical protein